MIMMLIEVECVFSYMGSIGDIGILNNIFFGKVYFCVWINGKLLVFVLC